MGFLERIVSAFTPKVPPLPPDDTFGQYIIDRAIDELTIEQMWREQPHLRTVTGFISRSIASVTLHVYDRADDGGRERQRGTNLARTMFKANSGQTMQDVLTASVMDLCLYDEFIWVVDRTSGEILPISPLWVQRYRWSDPWTLKSIVIDDTSTGRQVEIPGDSLIRVHGYSPGTYKKGNSPINALKDTLREQLEAAAYRSTLWKKGPRISGFITRPKDAPNWSAEARSRFKADMRATYTGRGSGVGGTPVLEDGMTFNSFHLKATDEQYVDVAKLSLATVASIYHINPTMVGLLDNANYSNVREFRRSLYGDSLGPIFKQIENALNAFYLPMLGIDADKTYIQFNLEEKLRASFEEKAAIITQSVGGPWMTRAEARAMENLPFLEGSDTLIIPLNTVEGDVMREMSQVDGGDDP